MALDIRVNFQSPQSIFIYAVSIVTTLKERIIAIVSEIFKNFLNLFESKPSLPIQKNENENYLKIISTDSESDARIKTLYNQGLLNEHLLSEDLPLENYLNIISTDSEPSLKIMALKKLGSLYYKKNPDEAIRWITQAACLNDYESMLFLAEHYNKKSEGSDIYSMNADLWYNFADELKRKLKSGL